MAGYTVESVEAFQHLFEEMLYKARAAKQTDTIEPPIGRSDIAELVLRVEDIKHMSKALERNRSFRYAVIETAVRGVFNDLLNSSSIYQPEFVNIWDLLDIVSILSDDERCDPALGFWLVEELLDSQTIAGCRKVFDYLESRRERMTAKHFKQKELVILRSCKELLRRLSRAEDTAFCGRVYVFMFQSFPLGDKSSVNLRGEYHVENITTFDELPPKTEDASDPMELDNETPMAEPKIPPSGPSGPMKASEESKNASKSVTFDSQEFSQGEKPLDTDILYPIFWSLQKYFSQPKRLFEQENLANFKGGLEATMLMFKSVQNEQTSRGSTRSVEEGKRGTKRKRGHRGDDLASTFNPKYLTSRDLFELEISDLSFRRHILVQALIIMDFLVFLSTKTKDKFINVKVPNKSVMYQEQILSDDDTKWALETKKSIADYLKQGSEGPFFYRMVESVLSRDKNWVLWKIEGCPSIERTALSPEEHLEAKEAAHRATTNKRLRSKPLGSLDCSFLLDVDGAKGMEKLKHTSRYRIPLLETFKDKIALDNMEIDMPTNDETKELAIQGKASKSWRALRVAGRTRLTAFDKIEDSEKIDVIFEDDPLETENSKEGIHDTTDAGLFPSDRRAVIISTESDVESHNLVQMFIDKYPKVFGKSMSHTTRPPGAGEADSVHYHFVDAERYNVMRDGDQFLEMSSSNGYDFATSRKALEAIVAAGKVPITQMDHQSVQQVKDQNYSARFIYIAQAPVIEELVEQSEIKSVYDKVIINDEPQNAFEEIEHYVFGKEMKEDLTEIPLADTSTTETKQSDEGDNREISTEAPILAPETVSIAMT